MMRDIFVVARNSIEYEYLLNNISHEAWSFELAHRMVHYVWQPDVLKGVHDARVFLYGHYFKRLDWPAIEATIQMNGLKTLLIR